MLLKQLSRRRGCFPRSLALVIAFLGSEVVVADADRVTDGADRVTDDADRVTNEGPAAGAIKTGDDITSENVRSPTSSSTLDSGEKSIKVNKSESRTNPPDTNSDSNTTTNKTNSNNTTSNNTKSNNPINSTSTINSDTKGNAKSNSNDNINNESRPNSSRPGLSPSFKPSTVFTRAWNVESPRVRSKLDITWKDCSSTSAHGKVTDFLITPPEPNLGEDFAVTGKGEIDEVVKDGAQFSLEIQASWISKEVDGAICGDTHIDFPLGLATADIHGLTCPTKPGPIAGLKVGLNVSRWLPVSHATMQLKTSDQSKAEIFCANLDVQVVSSIATSTGGSSRLDLRPYYDAMAQLGTEGFRAVMAKLADTTVTVVEDKWDFEDGNNHNNGGNPKSASKSESSNAANDNNKPSAPLKLIDRTVPLMDVLMPYVMYQVGMADLSRKISADKTKTIVELFKQILDATDEAEIIAIAENHLKSFHFPSGGKQVGSVGGCGRKNGPSEGEQKIASVGNNNREEEEQVVIV